MGGAIGNCFCLIFCSKAINKANFYFLSKHSISKYLLIFPKLGDNLNFIPKFGKIRNNYEEAGKAAKNI